ncbi:MAG: hypothetical protein FJW39_06245 [Acidobacteria bacterium]|nr:hypothetical protein [Acidobacteriota bacterium]
MNRLPDWKQGELPDPPPFNLRNAFRMIGPGAILLAASIGGGEWLAGPALLVQHGPSIMWVATAAIVLQVIFNLESIRYTLYTGEPVIAGFMRLRPGPRVWGGLYAVLTVAQLGLPALAAACASVVFAAFMGRMPGAPDAGSMQWITYGVMLLSAVILATGGTIEKTLERVSWAMIVFIFAFLLVVNVFFVDAATWWRTATGFFQFGYLPKGGDVVLLAALAATAGSGGIGNLVISSWVRDKGFGMGSVSGAIPGALGGRTVTLSRTGTVFAVTPESLRRWRTWTKYVQADQLWLWALGCFIGMFLNVNLAAGIIPPGTDLSALGAGAFQAQYLTERLWSGFWFLALLNGFWILFSTHLGNTDTLVRTVTDILWTSRMWDQQSVRRIYYTLLAAFTVWGAITANWGSAMTLFKALGMIAGPILSLAAVQLLIVNTTLLPPELRPGLARRAALVACAVFYFAMMVLVVI